MTWMEHHRVSEERFSDAEDLEKAGNIEGARRAYLAAAEAEERALTDLDPSKKRTRGISVVSVAALRDRAGQPEAAENWIHQHLAASDLTEHAKMRLKEHLQVIWSETGEPRPFASIPRAVLDVSMSGGEIQRGAAPANVVSSLIEGLRMFLIRTGELLNGEPYRLSGKPKKRYTDRYQPFILQEEPNSFHFSLSLAFRGHAESHPPHTGAEDVVERARDILWAGLHSPSQVLSRLVPDSRYEREFLRLAHDLTPSAQDHRFESIEIRSDRSDRTITLDRRSRRVLSDAMRLIDLRDSPVVEVRGILSGVTLVRHWIEVTTA